MVQNNNVPRHWNLRRRIIGDRFVGQNFRDDKFQPRLRALWRRHLSVARRSLRSILVQLASRPYFTNCASQKGRGTGIQIVSGRDGVMLARVHGLYANRNRGKCAHSGCVAIAAVPIPPLRRKLSRPHEHRLRDARHERRSRPDRFGVRHCERDFFYWLLRAANSGGVVGRTLERAAIAHVNSDNLGALTTLTGFVRTAHQLYGARFLLGAAEAGFFPGVIVYLSHWFIYQDRAKAVARFMSAIPIGF